MKRKSTKHIVDEQEIEYADYGKKSPKSNTESLTTVATEAEINTEKAIAFLKKMGYRILKPITNWEEV